MNCNTSGHVGEEHVTCGIVHCTPIGICSDKNIILKCREYQNNRLRTGSLYDCRTLNNACSATKYIFLGLLMV